MNFHFLEYFLINIINNVVYFQDLIIDYYYTQNFLLLDDFELNNKKNLQLKISQYISDGILQQKYIYNKYILLNESKKTSNFLEFYKILKNYKIHWNKILFILEQYLILIQKLIYEYNMSATLYWYSNSKILINKLILNSINQEELYYNISLDLLLDIQNESIKNIFFILKKYERVSGVCGHKVINTIVQNTSENYFNNRLLLKEIYKNYILTFKENPYKVIKMLRTLYQEYPRSTILSYGIDYDLNVWKTKKLIKQNNFNIMNNLQDIDLLQYYFKSMALEKKPVNYNMIDNQTYYNISNRKHYLRSLKKDGLGIILKNSSVFYDDSIADYRKSRLVKNFDILDIINYEKDFKYVLSKFIFDKIDKSKVYFDNIDRTTYWAKLKIYLRLLSKEGTFNDLRSNIFGGYTYWWSWHQDAFHIYGKKGSGGWSSWNEYTKLQIKKFGKFPVLIRKYHEEIKHKTYIEVKTTGRMFKRLCSRYGESDWGGVDTKYKKKIFKYLYEGRYPWKIEKSFFKNFMLSDDLWYSNIYCYASRDDEIFMKYLWKESLDDHEYHYGFVAGDRYSYLNFGFNIPKVKNPENLADHWFAMYNRDDAVLKKRRFKKSKQDEYIFSEIIPFLEMTTESHNENLKGVRGFLMKKYIIDSYINKSKLALKRKIEINNISWENFFTTIENSHEALNLNYINKNFYGRHAISDIDYFLVKKDNLYSNLILPKTKNVLIKKTYIENLISVYEKEEEPIKNYIYIRYIKNSEKKINYTIFNKIIKNSILDFFNTYKKLFELGLNKLTDKFLEIREINRLHNIFKPYYKYIWEILKILIICAFYCLISALLILLIKSYIPKNLIYGIKTKDNINLIKKLKKYWEPININEKIMKKDFFDIEPRYIYKWGSRLDKYFYENVLETKGNRKKYKNWKKILKSENIQKELRTTYAIFYKTFIFEKNLEKWENNTKIRADILLWAKYFGVSILGLLKGLSVYYRDRRLNHNRRILWNDPTLEKESKIKFFYEIPKLFFNIFFVYRFLMSIFQSWDYRFWVARWQQMLNYGVDSRLNLKELRKDLEKEWTLEWYIDNLDFGIAMLYTDWLKIKNKVDKIKNKKAEVEETIDYRKNLISNIAFNIFKRKNKLKIANFKKNIEYISGKRYLANLDLKFENIRERINLDVNKITLKEKAEQQIMFKYREDIQLKKMALEQEESEIISSTYIKRKARDNTDLRKTLVVYETADWNNAEARKKLKLWVTEYEKILREQNYQNNTIDKALDKKDRPFFESIKEYNEDLSTAWLAIEFEEKNEANKATAYEKFSKLLYQDLEKNYIWYRWFTTMGARFSYMWSLLITFSTIWVEHIKKVRKNEYSVESLLLIFKLDLSVYIYKSYWEYIILGKKYKTFKKLGYRIIDILKFSLIILTPLMLLAGSLYILLIIYLLLKIIENQYKNKMNIYIKKKNIIFFKDIKTGNNIFYYYINKWVYYFCTIFQNNIYYIKGAFKLGYKQKGLVYGIFKVFELLKYKTKTNINIKFSNKKIIINNLKKIIINNKNGIVLKLNIISGLWNLTYQIIKLHWILIFWIYKFIIGPIFKIDFITFYKIYKENIQLLKDYYKENLIKQTFILKNLTWKEIIILHIKYIFNFISLPIIFIINHQKLKYIKNYKQGFEAFWGNPTYLIIDQSKPNLKYKNDWKWKLHKMLLNQKISNLLKKKKLTYSSILEYFIIFKDQELRPKNVYQQVFWRTLHWNFKILKEDFYTWLIALVEDIEQYYENFENSLDFKNWFFMKRLWYSYKYYWIAKTSSKEYMKKQKMISRDLFFYNKAKDRKKIIKRYFIKGLINWTTYILFKKTFFNEINKMASQKLRIKKRKYKYIKYKICDISESYHVGTYLDDVPPQLWALVILYDIYLKQIIRYFYDSKNYPQDWDNAFEYTREFKWRLYPSINGSKPGFYNKAAISMDEATYKTEDMVTNIATTPFDPMLRWALFLIEYGLTTEDLNKEDIEGKELVWGDISMSHLLTYNKNLDQMQYEIREFVRLLDGTSLFRWAERQLAEDKLRHYQSRYDLVWNMLMTKNKNIMEHVLAERRLKSSKILHKALQRYIIKTPEQIEDELKTEQRKDYFYAKKSELFEENNLSAFQDWKAQWESKTIEEKYFSTNDLFNLKTSQEDHLTLFKLDMSKKGNTSTFNPLGYFKENIVLLSFDQTLVEMTHFLKFELWKILEENLKKNNKNEKGIINYKHLEIGIPSILKNINALEHNKILSKEEYADKTKRQILKDKILGKSKNYVYIKEIYKLLEWEFTKTEILYGFVENNLLLMFFETGAIYTYSDKIQFNDAAVGYHKEDVYFHGNEILLFWSYRLKSRTRGLRNLQKNKKKVKVLNKNFSVAYISNIRWSWAQWLGYENTEKEDKILDNNIIILNEKYRLWNIKRGPIRVKLPVILHIKEKMVKDYFFKTPENFSAIEFRYFLLGRATSNYVKYSLNWYYWRTYMEETYNKNILDFICWVLDPTENIKEAEAVRKQHWHNLEDITLNFSVFNKAYFVGFPHYSWDLMRYHDLFITVDEFPFDVYFRLKQEEFLLHDPVIKKAMAKWETVAMNRYKPGSYVWFYKEQFFSYWYILFSIFQYICILKILDILFYNPGFYIYNIYYLWGTIILCGIFWFLKKFVKDEKDQKQGADLYLYKYQAYEERDMKDIMQEELMITTRSKERFEFFDHEDLKPLNVDENKNENLEYIATYTRLKDWWRHFSHLDKNNKTFTFKKTFKITFLLFFYFFYEGWRTDKFRFRDSKFTWDYYKGAEIFLYHYIPGTPWSKLNYSTRTWEYDSWERLESGANIYSTWYVNRYKDLQEKKRIDLDYGLNSQKIKDIDVALFLDDTLEIFMQVGYSDLNHLALSKFLLTKIPINIPNDGLILKPQIRGFIGGDHFKKHFIQFKQRTVKLDEIELNLLDFLKSDLKEKFREKLIELVLGDRLKPKELTPLFEFLHFKKRMIDEYGYYPQNTYLVFTSHAKIETRSLIAQDLHRYKISDQNIFNDTNLRVSEYFLKKKKIFKNMDSIADVKTIASISEYDKHIQVLYYNLAKYKIKRFELLLDSPDWQKIFNKNHEKGFIEIYDEIKQKRDILYNDILEQELAHNEKILNLEKIKKKSEIFVVKSEQYIKKIFKKVSDKEQLEYKSNLLLNFFKEKKWSLLEDILIDYSGNKKNWEHLLDLCYLLVNFLSNIIN